MARQQKRVGKDALGSFAGIPRIVIESRDFKELSHTGKVLLLLMAYQYRGKNNGDLSAAPALLKGWGISSKTTISKAVQELVERNLIIRTREGRFLNPGGRCALYALTWKPIDECQGKIEVSPTLTPPRKFSMEARA